MVYAVGGFLIWRVEMTFEIVNGKLTLVECSETEKYAMRKWQNESSVYEKDLVRNESIYLRGSAFDFSACEASKQ